jgi:hypothetical protein
LFFFSPIRREDCEKIQPGFLLRGMVVRCKTEKNSVRVKQLICQTRKNSNSWSVIRLNPSEWSLFSVPSFFFVTSFLSPFLILSPVFCPQTVKLGTKNWRQPATEGDSRILSPQPGFCHHNRFTVSIAGFCLHYRLLYF